MKLIFSIFFLLLLHTLMFGQYNPDAGLITPFSEHAMVTVSSGNNVKYITDRNKNSYWESDSPLPSNYIKRKDLNLFLDQSAFSATQNIDKATDGDVNTNAVISPSNLSITFHNAQPLRFISVKYKADTDLTIEILTESGKSKIVTLKPENNYRLFKIELEQQTSSINFKSTKSFQLFEMAGLSKPITEYVLLDLKQPQPVGQLLIRALNSSKVEKIEVFGGTIKTQLTKLLDIKPAAIPLIPYLLKNELRLRYLKIVFQLPAIDYFKVKLWEVDVYDYHGPYGAPAKAKPSKHTYGESFGVNTFWGWGYNVYSDELPEGKGPGRFNKVCRLARNYHRLDWDTQTPQQIPDYNSINNQNSTTFRINWDKEYSQWKRAGFNIDASLLFNNDLFPDTLWKDPYQESFDLSKNFVTHFVKNKKYISQIEVGNEPWGYNPTVYKQILSGFSDWAKKISGAPIIPCAMQAFDPYPDANNYIKRYLNKNILQKINGLNTHVYNYIYDKDGTYTAVNPEDPRAETWSLNNLRRYLNYNAPGKDIFVTEFGYDSDGGSETCTHTVCVSEKIQAIYGIRTALILWRLGASQFYWYYFANVAYQSFLHNRSGLISSSKAGFNAKAAFFAFEKLFLQLKDYKFQKVVSENENYYAYLYQSKNHQKIIIVWRPTFTNHFKHQWISLPGEFNIESFTPLLDDEKTRINGQKLFVSGIPVILKIVD